MQVSDYELNSSAQLHEWVLCKVYEEKGESDNVPYLNSDSLTAEDVAGAQLLLDLKVSLLLYD